jgi:hypothetical protein
MHNKYKRRITYYRACSFIIKSPVINKVSSNENSVELVDSTVCIVNIYMYMRGVYNCILDLKTVCGISGKYIRIYVSIYLYGTLGKGQTVEII